MSAVKMITAVLLVVGGLNWGLVGIFHFNLVAALFGDETIMSRGVYTLVGLSAVIQAFTSLPEEFRRSSSPNLRASSVH